MSELLPREEIEGALKGHDADYIEVRIDDTSTNRIVYRGRELEEIGRSRSFGGNVRALVNGGWGFVSFNDATGLRQRVAEAVSQARHVGGGGSGVGGGGAGGGIGAPVGGKDPGPISPGAKKAELDRGNEAR